MHSLLLAKVNIAAMKGILGFFSIFSLVFGLLFLFSPKTVTALNEWGNRVLFQPKSELRNNVVIGLFMILLGVAMGFLACAK